MNYGTGELEIVERLNIKFAEKNVATLYEAVLMPETEQQFQAFYQNFTKARVAIQYIDSSYQPSVSIGIVTQYELVRFRVSFEARKLRGEGGLYNMMELVKLFLIGYRLSNADGLSCVKYGLLEFEQNSWQPYLEFECKTLNAEASTYEEPPIGGTLKNVVFTEEFINEHH